MCKILDRFEIEPHKLRYYLERRHPEFDQKKADVLCVYREVKTMRAAPGEADTPVAIISYDEKPGIQAIGTTAPDLPPWLVLWPAPGPHQHACLARCRCWPASIC